MMSSAGTETVTGAARVGADLRAARERLGWTLPEVAAGLRIRLPYLEAIEDGRVKDLPGAAYALGFLRTYAQSLGLDPDELSRRFRAEAGDVNRKTELTFPVPVPERGVPAGAVVLLGVLLAVGAYIGWYRLSDRGVLPPEVVPPVPERLAPLAEQAVPPSLPPVSPVPAPASPAAVADAPPAAVPSPSVSPTSAAAATAAPPIPAAPVPNPDDPRIVVRAKGDAWIQVREKQGPVIYDHVMHAGDTWTVPAKPALLLTTGNAGGTELLVDGTATAPLGAPGSVRRNLVLDPDQIKDGKIVSATPTPAPAPAAPAASPKTPAQ